MNIHKTKIEWCSHTWNPVTGCRHDCPYCYARRIATRFGPKIDEFPDESGITAFINEGVDCYVVEKPTELKDWQGNYRRFQGRRERDPINRAKTFPGIAAAMAEQWAGPVTT